jgi:aldose 1-epimerase
MRFRVSTETRDGGVVHRLHDDQSGASASVLPAFGFNLFDLQLPVGGKVRPVLASYPDWADNPRDFGRNGTPVLFPFPNRIALGRYRFGDRDFQLPAASGQHAIHGFAIRARWEVVEHRADENGAWILGRYQISRQSPDSLAFWPTDAVLQIRYHLAGQTLTLEATVSNPTAVDLPYGFGIHPYFRLPIDPAGDPHKTRITLPASQYWVLDGYIPTGERRDVDARLDFRNGQPNAGLKLDDVLTGIDPAAERVCRLQDQNLGANAEFRLGFDSHIRELVVFTPPNSPGVISIEPYTQTTDAINLAARGIDGGLRVLSHDQSETLVITMQTSG